MVYKFDEYVEAFPKKNVSTLKKFVGEAKNLHEMSVEEINEAVKTVEFSRIIQTKSRKMYIHFRGIEVE